MKLLVLLCLLGFLSACGEGVVGDLSGFEGSSQLEDVPHYKNALSSDDLKSVDEFKEKLLAVSSYTKINDVSGLSFKDSACERNQSNSVRISDDSYKVESSISGVACPVNYLETTQTLEKSSLLNEDFYLTIKKSESRYLEVVAFEELLGFEIQSISSELSEESESIQSDELEKESVAIATEEIVHTNGDVSKIYYGIYKNLDGEKETSTLKLSIDNADFKISLMISRTMLGDQLLGTKVMRNTKILKPDEGEAYITFADQILNKFSQ